MQNILSRLPKVDLLLAQPEIITLLDDFPRALVLKAIRETLDRLRDEVLNQGRTLAESELSLAAIVTRVEKKARRLGRPKFRRVVNGTGVIIHTNLGRSLIAEEALEAIRIAGRYYSNLEYDLDKGRRGSRYSHVEDLLCELTGARAALVVNNNAAAVLISLETLARNREVIVSRGELVEIGGSFRIPDVMARSGAILVEAGTTNKTHLRDYEQLINENTGLLLKVHQSNFRIIGFAQQVDARDLVGLGRQKGLPVMEDLGSGSLMDFSKYGLNREPTVQETVAAGVDVTTFSGDKLLGGPQAGLIIGSKDIIDRIKKNPLNRALRIDKFTLSCLEATLRLYLDEETALNRVPILKMIAASPDNLRRRAARLKRKLDASGQTVVRVGTINGFSQIGGGALPEQDMPTRLVALTPLHMSVNQLEEKLRDLPTPVIGRIENDQLLLDVRTMTDEDFDLTGFGLFGA